MIMDNLYTVTLISLGVNIVTLIALFSPNIVMIIHRKWFDWKKDK
jgi:hypothetical protein